MTNANEDKTPTKIDTKLRSAIMTVLQRLAYYHPALRTAVHDSLVPPCRVCRDVAFAALLDAEQREHGPAIDVTDASYLRERAKAQAAGR